MTKLKESLPEVRAIDTQDDSVKLTLWVDRALDYFNGHFPEAPILAGVVQLDWAVKYAIEHFSLSSHLVENVEVLKFQVVIVANSLVELTLTKKSDNKFTFSFHSDHGQHSSGRVVLHS
ncbi:thioester dehydrase [Pseudoalteromonas sp. SSM20]|uniref:ApeI family dehydratase n=1 Tax=Pseudoalteromonas sp. SSM20 TaxID=3139394 RepID=UPI003BAD30E0